MKTPGDFPKTVPDPYGVQTAHGVIYLAKTPTSVPAGFVVVHNNQRPRARLGHVFRAWLALPDANVAVCSCDWAPHLGQHYRSGPIEAV